MFDARILRDAATGLTLDLTDAPPLDLAALGPALDGALRALTAIEAGAIANADEGRQVGHYWLRDPDRAPEPTITAAIRDVHARVAALDPGAHTDVLVIGIGGSALGPQLVADALGAPTDRARVHFLDNTDPEGMARTLGALDPARTLAVVISKSGGTPETRNGLLAAQSYWVKNGANFAEHAIAITGEGSVLDREAQGWLARFPLWEWVGGRTSVTGPVGLVPMALCGQDWRGLLAGARAADALGRRPAEENPAALLAAARVVAGDGRGDRALVVEPYRDRLLLLSRYLQQLVMESLGKALDRAGRPVAQGLVVYGNKGSTDQHAFMQQVRDGRDDSFVHFIETVAHGPLTPVDAGFDASDHLVGLMAGTRRALAEAGRPSLTLTVPDVDAHALGLLIGLFERAVGIYAELIDVNAYHQPGVEAGKKAAKAALSLLDRLAGALGDTPETADALAARTGGGDPLLSWRLLTHLAATGRATGHPGDRPADDRFSRRQALG